MTMVKKSGIAKKMIFTSMVCATALFGESESTVDLGKLKVESSTISEKFQAIQNDVSSVSIVSEEAIEKLNPQSVADILDTIPGITYSLVGTDALKVHIRGVDNQMYMGEKPGVAIVIDGVPVQETTGKINVDLDNIASIKVIKGGASYLYGNDAIAGAIVITTKKPKAGSRTKVETEYGTFDTKRFMVSTNQAFENSAFQLQGNSRDTDGYWDDAYVRVKSVNGKYQYYITDSSEMTVGFDISQRETGDGNSVSGVTEAKENPTSKGYYSYGGYYDSDLTKYFITYSSDIGEESNMMLRVHRYEDDKNYKLARYTKDNDEIWSQDGAKGEFRTTAGSFAVMAGFDIQRNNTDEVSYDIADGTPQSGWGAVDGEKLAEYETKETINAGYTEIKHQTTENLISTLNIRHDSIKHEYKDEMDSDNDVDPSYEGTSYRLGFNYALNKSQHIYTSVSTGFRTPTVGQVSTNQVALAADPTLNFPKEIDLETTYNYEIGIKGKTGGNLNYSVAIFQLDRKNYIGRIAGSYITSDDDEENGYDNVGDMQSRGLELGINSDKSKAFSYNLAYTYLEAKFTDYTISQQQTTDPDGWGPLTATYARKDLSGNYVSRSPKHTAYLGVDYKATESFTISPEVYYKGEYYADEANEFKQDAYEVVNLKLNYNFDKSIEFFGKITNLMDKEYYEFVNVNSSALATMEDATIRVAEPRAFYAGVRAKF